MLTFKQLRDKKKMTRSEFARQMGVSRQTVYNWEKGDSPMNKSSIFLASKILDADAEDIKSILVNV